MASTPLDGHQPTDEGAVERRRAALSAGPCYALLLELAGTNPNAGGGATDAAIRALADCFGDTHARLRQSLGLDFPEDDDALFCATTLGATLRQLSFWFRPDDEASRARARAAHARAVTRLQALCRGRAAMRARRVLRASSAHGLIQDFRDADIGGTSARSASGAPGGASWRADHASSRDLLLTEVRPFDDGEPPQNNSSPSKTPGGLGSPKLRGTPTSGHKNVLPPLAAGGGDAKLTTAGLFAGESGPASWAPKLAPTAECTSSPGADGGDAGAAAPPPQSAAAARIPQRPESAMRQRLAVRLRPLSTGKTLRPADAAGAADEAERAREGAELELMVRADRLASELRAAEWKREALRIANGAEVARAAAARARERRRVSAAKAEAVMR